MKAQDFSRFFRPLHVLIAGALGGGILALMFSPYFPVDCGNGVITFFCVPGFSVVFFLMGILWSLMTIFLPPGWGMFLWLLKRYFTEKDKRFRSRELFRLLATGMIIAIISYIVFQSLSQFSPEAQSRWLANVPEGVQLILGIHSVYFFIVILPYVLGISLVNSIIREISIKIRDLDNNQSQHDQAFGFISHVLIYRRMLQLFLIVAGIMLSMFPLIAIALRSVLIAIDPQMDKFYPVSYVIFQGLLFTMLLLFIYVPTYLDLSVVGRQIRDVLCPLSSLNDLKDTVEKRKTLDHLLQTEGSFATNLRSSLLPLSPLISSLLVLLGIRI
jgi:hypothetical protein